MEFCVIQSAAAWKIDGTVPTGIRLDVDYVIVLPQVTHNDERRRAYIPPVELARISQLLKRQKIKKNVTFTYNRQYPLK